MQTNAKYLREKMFVSTSPSINIYNIFTSLKSSATTRISGGEPLSRSELNALISSFVQSFTMKSIRSQATLRPYEGQFGQMPHLDNTKIITTSLHDFEF